MITCPHCHGKAMLRVLVCPGAHWRDEVCSTCNGAGTITTEHQARIERGAAMRDERRARRVSQSERAAELGMDVVAYSKLENGRL